MRYALLAVAALHGLNGLFMLSAPELWYASIPGVSDTGPANGHFIRDIALSFIAAAAGLMLAARNRDDPSLLAAPALFLGGHALLHLAEMAAHGAAPAAAIRDILMIILPGLLPAVALVLHLRYRKEAF